MIYRCVLQPWWWNLDSFISILIQFDSVSSPQFILSPDSIITNNVRWPSSHFIRPVNSSTYFYLFNLESYLTRKLNGLPILTDLGRTTHGSRPEGSSRVSWGPIRALRWVGTVARERWEGRGLGIKCEGWCGAALWVPARVAASVVLVQVAPAPRRPRPALPPPRRAPARLPAAPALPPRARPVSTHHPLTTNTLHHGCVHWLGYI